MRRASQFLVTSFLLLMAGNLSEVQAIPAQKPAKQVPPTAQRSLSKRELTQFKQQVLEKINTDLGLAGIDKQQYPPFYDPKLGAYRSRWNRLNPEVAPFLGYWVDDYGIFPPYYTLMVIPSQVRGKMCVIETGDYQYPGGNPVGEVIPPNPPPKLSVVQVAQGRGGGNGLRFDRTLLTRVKGNWLKQEVEALGVVNAKSELRVYAAKSVPTLDAQLPEPLKQQLQAHQCQIYPN